MRTNARPSPRRCNGCSPANHSDRRPARHSHARRRGRLKRNKLTHKHTDLKDLFNAERRARDGVPDSELRPRRDHRLDQEDQDAERGTRPVPDGERDLRASNERPHHRERQPSPGHRETQIVQRHITAIQALKSPRSVPSVSQGPVLCRRFHQDLPDGGHQAGTVAITEGRAARAGPGSTPLRGPSAGR